MEQRHLAYNDPSYPTNAVYDAMVNPQSREGWAEPEAVAAAMYRVVSRGERIPIRVPLGQDAWNMIRADVDGAKNELEEIKEVSFMPSRAD